MVASIMLLILVYMRALNTGKEVGIMKKLKLSRILPYLRLGRADGLYVAPFLWLIIMSIIPLST